MALHDQRAVMAIKIETTAGVAETLAAADGTINIFNGSVMDETEFIQRQGQGSASLIRGSHGARAGRATFQTDLTPGSGAHPPWALQLLAACGYVASTNTYTPRTENPGSNVKTVTIAKYTDGLYEQIHGAMGTARFNFVAGRTCLIDWDFVGVYTSATDVALIAPTYDTQLPLRFVSSALTVGSYTPKVESLTFDFGNSPRLLEDSRSATGYSHAVIETRNPTITINPETSLVAQVDIWGDWQARQERALSWALSEGGIGASFSAPAAQLSGPPRPGRRGSVRVDDLVYELHDARTGSPSSIDDAVSIVFDHTP